MFKELVKAKHELPESTKDQPSPITKDDENALRYVSGYVCRKVQEKIKSSSIPHKVGFRGNLLGSLEHPLLGIVNNILAIRVRVCCCECFWYRGLRVCCCECFWYRGLREC